jgi:hypothetical protein
MILKTAFEGLAPQDPSNSSERQALLELALTDQNPDLLARYSALLWRIFKASSAPIKFAAQALPN